MKTNEKIERFRNTEYYVSDSGNVYSNKFLNMKELKQVKMGNGYKIVTLYIDDIRVTRLVHRLVAECFLSNYSESLQVNHIDCVRDNNNIENLEMVTCKENTNHTQRCYFNRKPFNIKLTNYYTKEIIIVKTYKDAQLIMGYKTRGSILSLLNGGLSRKGFLVEKMYV